MPPKNNETYGAPGETPHESMTEAEINARLQSEFHNALEDYCHDLIRQADRPTIIDSTRRLVIVGFALTCQRQEGEEAPSPWVSWTATVQEGLREYAEHNPESHDAVMGSSIFRLEGHQRAVQVRQAAAKLIRPRPKSAEELIEVVTTGTLRLKKTTR